MALILAGVTVLRFAKTFFISLVFFATISAFMHIVATGRHVENVSVFLGNWSKSLAAIDPGEHKMIQEQLRRRVRFYEEEIEKYHISDGMLVNRTVDGMMIDQCDSLLFSSLRYAALSKLGYTERALKAWAGIEGSQIDGVWQRHPRCNKSTSRDMIVGLLVAMTQYPDELDVRLKELFSLIDDNLGFFDEGPFHVSYVTPGLAEMLRRVALAEDLRHSELPLIVKNGFSTFEWASFATGRGYEAHLVALSILLELELQDTGFRKRKYSSNQSLTKSISPLASVFLKQKLANQRLELAAQNLVQLDPKNLFFKYLRLRTADALTGATRQLLMKELLSMSQFPRTRLPMDCDRKADYLWQRSSEEYTAKGYDCSLQFNGVDFIWMASLLLEE